MLLESVPGSERDAPRSEAWKVRRASGVVAESGESGVWEVADDETWRWHCESRSTGLGVRDGDGVWGGCRDGGTVGDCFGASEGWSAGGGACSGVAAAAAAGASG